MEIADKSVKVMQAKRDEIHARIMRSQMCRRGSFTVAATARFLNGKKSTARGYLKKLEEDGKLDSATINGTVYYSPAVHSLASVSWRVNESLYAEMEEALHDL